MSKYQNAYTIIWMKMYEKLKSFYTKYGHCDVSQNDVKNRKLGLWVSRQRQAYKKDKLEPEKIDLLNKVSFKWEGPYITNAAHNTKNWDARLEELAKFKEKFGHCNVSQSSHKKYYKLARWLNTQRTSYAKDTLEPDRVDRLESLGVVWNMEDFRFEERLKELLDFHEKHGHFNVPQKYAANPKLGMWVALIRSRGTTPERRKRLNEIGFNWVWKTKRKTKAGK